MPGHFDLGSFRKRADIDDGQFVPVASVVRLNEHDNNDFGRRMQPDAIVAFQQPPDRQCRQFDPIDIVSYRFRKCDFAIIIASASRKEIWWAREDSNQTVMCDEDIQEAPENTGVLSAFNAVCSRSVAA